jgi:phage baseplate assembly protein W
MIKPVDVDDPFRMTDGGYPNTAQGRAALSLLIKDCLLTSPGERPYRPTYGSWLRRVLFANLGTPSLLQASVEVNRAVGTWVPQVTIVGTDFVIQDTTIRLVVSWSPSGSSEITTTPLEFRL